MRSSGLLSKAIKVLVQEVIIRITLVVLDNSWQSGDLFDVFWILMVIINPIVFPHFS